MNALAASRDVLMPRPPEGMGRGAALAFLVHVLLVLGLAFSVNWRSSEPEGIEAELWASTPQIAAPKAVEPEPEPTPPPPRPQPKPAETPPPPQVAKPDVDAQIAIDRAKREEAKKLEEARLQEEEDKRKKQLAKQEAEKREKEEQKKLALQEQQRQKEEEAKKKAAEDKKLAALRQANLKRMMGQADGTSDPDATGTSSRTAGPSAGYVGRIKARIKPNVVFPDTIDGNPAVEVAIRVAPDGAIVSSRVVKSSGVPEWDDAVLKGIEKTAVLPRDVDGSVPPQMLIVYRPRD